MPFLDCDVEREAAMLQISELAPARRPTRGCCRRLNEQNVSRVVSDGRVPPSIGADPVIDRGERTDASGHNVVAARSDILHAVEDPLQLKIRRMRRGRRTADDSENAGCVRTVLWRSSSRVRAPVILKLLPAQTRTFSQTFSPFSRFQAHST